MITTQEMKELEESSGIPRIQLMENAGRGIFSVLKDKFPELKDKKILVVCYHGNNGGDGFVAARYLSEESGVDVLFIGDETKLKEEARINFRKIKNNDRIQVLVDPEQADFDDYDIIIDALLGTGTEGSIKQPISQIIDLVNSSSAYKVSVDIPTGLDPDTGEIHDKIINADLIITMHDIKSGLERYKDKTVIVDIGIRKD